MNPAVILGVCPGLAPLLSEDDGVTWTMLQGAELDRTLTAFALADGRFLLGGVEDVKGVKGEDAQRGIMRAIDPRSRAVVASSTRTARPITGYVFDVDRQVSIAVDAAGTVYRVDGANLSTQELATLHPASPDGFIDLFCCDDAGYAYAGAKGMGVWRSIDGGRQWQHVVLHTLDSDADIFSIGSGPLGKPTFYTNRGLLQAGSARRVCLTDTLCVEWSQETWSSRVRRFIPLPLPFWK